MSIEAYLEDEGFEVVAFGSAAEAMTWLRARTPRCVVLDYSLKDGPCLSLARELASRGVPFLIYSGYQPAAAPPELANVPWVEKPVPRHELMAALWAVSARPSLSAGT
jgi:DNA-binding response OmpR family regulator